jgi:hypothetical protein
MTQSMRRCGKVALKAGLPNRCQELPFRIAHD